MAKRKFKTDLSIKGINILKTELLEYKNKILQQNVQTLVKRLSESGVGIAKTRIATLGAVFDGDLINSIHTKDGGGSDGTAVFYIVADSDHAVFVEFGTGQMGEEAPYPYLLPEGVEWNYNTGKTIFEVSPGQYGWFYPKNGKWYFTQGMPARPFMYETAMELQSEVVKIAREVFGK